MDIGNSGRHNDGWVLSNSDYGQALINDSVFITYPYPLTGTTVVMLPYVIVADEAFSLKMNMVWTYPGSELPGILNIIYLKMHFAFWLFH